MAKVGISDVWPPLEDGLTHLLTKLTEGFAMTHYMKLYRCASYWALKAHRGQLRVQLLHHFASQRGRQGQGGDWR